MHDSALDLGRRFFELYGPGKKNCLDIGSMDLNGTLRSVCPSSISYTGVDQERGPGVDFVVPMGKPLPFDEGSFDLITATSVLEHDPRFWTTVDDAFRVLAPGGFLYLNTPSNGHYHAHPLDCWRFQPDAGVALVRWLNLYAAPDDPDAELVESFTAGRMAAEWNDMVIVIGKSLTESPKSFIVDQVGATNVRKRGTAELLNPVELTEDQRNVLYLARTSRELVGRWVDEFGELAPEDLVKASTDFLKSFGITV